MSNTPVTTPATSPDHDSSHNSTSPSTPPRLPAQPQVSTTPGHNASNAESPRGYAAATSPRLTPPGQESTSLPGPPRSGKEKCHDDTPSLRSLEFHPGNKGANERLERSVARLQARNHPSTIYPPHYMPKKSFYVEYAYSLIFGLHAALFVLGAALMHNSESATKDTTNSLLILAVFSLTLALVHGYSLEFIHLLNLRGTQIINVGSIVSFVYYRQLYSGSVGAPESTFPMQWGAYIGGLLLTVGTMVFCYCSYITGPWQFMVGSTGLSLGLLLRLMATGFLVMENDHNSHNGTTTHDDTVAAVELAAVPFFIIALAFVGPKAYMHTRRPWLTFPNFMLYGICLYGGGILCQVTLTTLRQFQGSEEEIISTPQLAACFGAARALTCLGTTFFVLRSARSAWHVDSVVEDRYPLANYLVGAGEGGFGKVWLALGLWLIAGAAATFGGIFYTQNGHFTVVSSGSGGMQLVASTSVRSPLDVTGGCIGSGERVPALLEAVCNFGLALACGLLMLAVGGRPEDGSKHPLGGVRLQCGGALLQSAGYAMAGVSAILQARESDLHERLSTESGGLDWLKPIGHLVCALGAVCWLVLAVRWADLSARFRSLSALHFNPFRIDWPILLLHPSNYVALASLVLLAADVLLALHFRVFGYTATMAGGIILLLHMTIAFDVFEMNHVGGSHASESGDQPDEEERQEEQQASTEQKLELAPEITIDVSTLRFDVVICGSGPAGLMLACQLGRRGVKTLVVEKREDVITDARFAVLNANSVECLLATLDADLMQELFSRALPAATPFGSMLLTGLGHDDAEVLCAANTPPREAIMQQGLYQMDSTTESRCMGSKFARELPIRVMQSHQEIVLRKQAARLSEFVELRYGWELLDFAIHERVNLVSVDRTSENLGEAVVANIEAVKSTLGKEQEPAVQEHSSEESVHQKDRVIARFICGCDGPGSLVCKTLGFQFDGFVNLARTRSLLVKAPGLYDRVLEKVGATHQYQIIRENWGLAGIVAADPSRDLWNFLMLFGERIKTADTKDIVREFLGTDDFEILQDRFWYWNFFVAQQWQMGCRAFLVGDAAHSWPPFGGIGGNTAYGDAHNLGWKLAAAVKAERVKERQAKGDESSPKEAVQHEALLKSYDIERRQAVMRTAMFVLRATPRPELLKKLISPVFQKPLIRSWIGGAWYFRNSGVHSENHFCQSGIQFGVKLNFSPVTGEEAVVTPDDPSCSYTPCLRSGARLPMLYFKSNGTIYDSIGAEGYTLLVFGPAGVKASKQFRDTFGKKVRALYQSGHEALFPIKEVQVDVTSICPQKSDRQVHDMYREHALVVVRPDFYVAWRLTTVDQEEGQSGEDGFELPVSIILGLQKPSIKQQQRSHSYQRWLRRQFIFNLRPFAFNFPSAQKISGSTKGEVRDALRAGRGKKAGEKEWTGETKQTTVGMQETQKCVKEVSLNSATAEGQSSTVAMP